MCIINNTSNDANGVESVATNLVIGDVLNIIMEKRKTKRKMNIELRSLKVYAITVVRRGM